MMAESGIIKKNSYELVSMTDGDSSECELFQQPINNDIHLRSSTIRRKRLRKRLPGSSSRRYDDIHKEKCCGSSSSLIPLSFVIVMLCCWLLILSWVIVIFNEELRRFDSNLKLCEYCL